MTPFLQLAFELVIILLAANARPVEDVSLESNEYLVKMGTNPPPEVLKRLDPQQGGVQGALKFLDAPLGVAEILTQAARYGLVVVVPVVLLGVVVAVVMPLIGVAVVAVVRVGIFVVVVIHHAAPVSAQRAARDSGSAVRCR